MVIVTKKTIRALICFTLVLFLTGCAGNRLDPGFRDYEAFDEKYGFEGSLHLTYEEFKKKYGERYAEQNNGLCTYFMAQSEMPEGRQVYFNYIDIYNSYREAKAVEITSKGADISEKRMIRSTSGKHFPVDQITAMTGFDSLEAMAKDIGLPAVYEELGDSCAFAFVRDSGSVRVYYGNKDNCHSEDIDLTRYQSAFSSKPSIQMTEDNIYFFEDTESSADSYITVTKIPRDGGEAVTKKIMYSDVELPNLRNLDSCQNIFVDDGYLFFIGSFITSQTKVNGLLQREFDIVMYDLKTDKYDIFRLDNLNYLGKLFKFGDGLGVITITYDELGYSTILNVRFLDVDKTDCTLSFDRDLPLTISTPWEYMYSSGNQFYCIGDTLCGAVKGKLKGRTSAYVEFDLTNGQTTTFVPLALSDRMAYRGIADFDVIIRDSGRAVSPHNC